MHEPVDALELRRYRLDQRLLLELLEHRRAGLEDQLEKLVLVILGIVGQQHIAEQLVV